MSFSPLLTFVDDSCNYNPADALKEHVSNAIDEHLKAQVTGTALERCHVVFTLDKRTISADSNILVPVFGSTRNGTIIRPESASNAARCRLFLPTLWRR